MSKFYFVLLFSLVVTISGLLCQPSSGNEEQRRTRRLAIRHPYSVSLRNANRHVCSGALVGNYTVVTAAHCVDPRFQKDALPSLWLSSTHSDVPSAKAILRETTEIVRHPQYSIRDSSRYDIAILTMNQTAWPLRPIRVFRVDADLPLVGRQLSYLGYGRLSSGGALSTALHITQVEVLDPESCSSLDINFARVVMLCISEALSCSGDEGGPLFVDRGDAREDTLVAIASGTTCNEDFDVSGMTNANAPLIRTWLDNTLTEIEARAALLNAEIGIREDSLNAEIDEPDATVVGSEVAIEETLDLLF